MSDRRIDHLVMAAADLEHGRAWVEDLLEVPLEPGGEHPMWGTHNALLSLGPDTYLEVLAVNAAVARPGPAYPMGLGSGPVRNRLRRSPFLLHWVVRGPAVPGDGVGEYHRGANRWRLQPAPEGDLVLGGVAPTRIEWLTPHPASLLPDRGVRLLELRLVVPDAAELRAVTAAGDLADPRLVVAESGPGTEPELRATLRTPGGQVTLGRHAAGFRG